VTISGVIPCVDSSWSYAASNSWTRCILAVSSSLGMVLVDDDDEEKEEEEEDLGQERPIIAFRMEATAPLFPLEE